MAIDLHQHQLKALREIHHGCILKGGVGTGKTRTAFAYFYLHELQARIPINGKGEVEAPKTPKDIYVITTAKKRDSLDWEAEAAAFRIGPDRETSIGGVQLKVDSWNNVVNYTEVKDAFFIFDEQRLVGTGAWVKAFYKIAAQNRWIMLSATPGDNWMDYIPVLVANGHYKNRSEFVRRHVIFSSYAKFPKVEGYREEDVLLGLRDRILVDMPYARHTRRHTRILPVDYDKDLFRRVAVDRWHIFEERPLRDVAELFIVMRKLVNSHPSRLAAVMKVLEKHPRLIVFYNHNHELEMLRTLSNTLGIPMAEWNGHKHQEIPDTDKWLYLVQYTAGAEGWNCITTDAILFYSLNYSYKINEQAKGRIDRLNTPFIDLYYYVLRSSALIDVAITKSLNQKKSFNERSLMKKFEQPKPEEAEVKKY